jgi:hypothetical protein
MRCMVFVLMITMLLLVACVPQTIPSEKICQTDSDCVPSTCCHATDAVNKDYAPDCSGKLCTLECVPGSIDCGQGNIVCVESSCVVIL